MEQQELEQQLQELRQGKLSHDETYHMVATFGKQHYLEAHPDIERLLGHENAELRNIALVVLGFDWHREEHWETALHMLQHDPDDNNRLTAASVLGTLKVNTGDRLVLQALAQVVHNAHEDLFVRKAAYFAMKAILHYDYVEQRASLRKPFEPEQDVDWELVNSYLYALC